MQTTDLVRNELLEIIYESISFSPTPKSCTIVVDPLIQSVSVFAPGLPDDDSFGPNSEDKGVCERGIALRLPLLGLFEDAHVDKGHNEHSRDACLASSQHFGFSESCSEGSAWRAVDRIEGEHTPCLK
jgi:hypothetical protein